MPHPSETFGTLYQSALPTPIPIPGSSYPPQFSWTQNPYRPTMESRAPALVASGLGGLQVLAGVAIGGAGMLRLGEMAGWQAPRAVTALSRLDPFAAAADAGGAVYTAATTAANGTRTALTMGGAVRVGMAAFSASLAPAALMYGAGTAFTHGLQGMMQQGALHHQMQGSFYNANAVAGRGYGARDLMSIGTMLRQTDRADPFTSMADLGSMTDSFHAMGMQQGLRDAEAGARKLKTMIDTVRNMSRTLGASVQEATAVFGSMRASGLYSQGAMADMTRSMQTAEAMGVGRGAFLGGIGSGAAMARGMGMTGASGAMLMAGSMRGLGLDMSRGSLSAERLMDITGGANAEEATVLMGQRLASKAAGILGGTSVGKAILATLGAKKDGKYTGGIDSAALEGLLSGGKLSDLSRLAYNNMGNDRASKASFVTRQEDIASSLAQSGGGEDLLTLIGSLAMSQSGDDEDMAKVYLEHLGIRDRREAEMVLAAAKNRSARRKEGTRKLRQSLAANEMRERQQLGLSRGGLTSIYEGMTSPFEQAGAGLYTDMSMFAEHVKDRAYGISRYNLSDDAYEGYSRDLAAGGLAAPSAVAGRAYRGFAGRLIPAATNLVSRDTVVALSAGVGGAIGTAAGLSAGVGPLLGTGVAGAMVGEYAGGTMYDAFQNFGTVSGDTLAMMQEVQQRGEYDALGAVDPAMREKYAAIGAGAGSGKYGFGLKMAAEVSRNYADFYRTGGVMDSLARFDLEEAAVKVPINMMAWALGHGATRSRAGAAALASLPGGNLLVGQALGGDLTMTSDYASQEEAKAAAIAAFTDAGVDSSLAEQFASGGATADTLNALYRRSQSGEGAGDYAWIKKAVSEIRGSSKYAVMGSASASEEYLASQVASMLAKQTGRKVTAAEARAVIQGTEGSAENFQSILSAANRLGTTSFLNERKKGALYALRGENAGALTQLAPDVVSGLEAAAYGDGYGGITQGLGVSNMSGLLDTLSSTPGAEEALRGSSGRTDKAVAAALARYTAARGMGSTEDILRAYDVSKDSAEYSRYAQMSPAQLVRQLGALDVASALSPAGTGGTTMLNGGVTAQEREARLTTAVSQMASVTATLYNKMVDKRMISGDKVTVPAAQDLGALSPSGDQPFGLPGR